RSRRIGAGSDDRSLRGRRLLQVDFPRIAVAVESANKGFDCGIARREVAGHEDSRRLPGIVAGRPEEAKALVAVGVSEAHVAKRAVGAVASRKAVIPKRDDRTAVRQRRPLDADAGRRLPKEARASSRCRRRRKRKHNNWNDNGHKTFETSRHSHPFPSCQWAGPDNPATAVAATAIVGTH